MELFTLLFANSGTIFGVLSGVVAIASLITAGTKTPDPNTGLGKAYKVIEMLALVVGKAKDTGSK